MLKDIVGKAFQLRALLRHWIVSSRHEDVTVNPDTKITVPVHFQRGLHLFEYSGWIRHDFR